MLRNPAPISVHYDQLLHGGLFQSLHHPHNILDDNLHQYVAPMHQLNQTLLHNYRSPLLHKHLHPKLRNPAPTYFRSVPLLHGTHFLSGLPRYAYAAACCYWKNWSYLLLSLSSSCWNCWMTYWRKLSLHLFWL